MICLEPIQSAGQIDAVVPDGLRHLGKLQHFGHAELRLATLEGAVLTDATGLTQSRLNDACGDKSTQLPEELTVNPC